MKQQIKIEDVKNLLENGYERLAKDETEPGLSIQSHYGLKQASVISMFKDPRLKGLKTRYPEFELVSEETPVVPLTAVPAQEDTTEDEPFPAILAKSDAFEEVKVETVDNIMENAIA